MITNSYAQSSATLTQRQMATDPAEKILPAHTHRNQAKRGGGRGNRAAERQHGLKGERTTGSATRFTATCFQENGGLYSDKGKRHVRPSSGERICDTGGTGRAPTMTRARDRGLMLSVSPIGCLWTVEKSTRATASNARHVAPNTVREKNLCIQNSQIRIFQ